MKYAVRMMDEATMDETMVFKGTLAECKKIAAECNEIAAEYGEEPVYIVAPDGFTVIE